MSDLPDYAKRNREHWTQANARYTAGAARNAWAQDYVHWGVWLQPEEKVRALPHVRDRDVIELGCGTAYFGAWLKKLGARRVVGVDVTPAQLETARAMNADFGLGLELIEASAEVVPLADATFDLAVSEYGASIWCDPYIWIPEAARLLRPSGELIFLRNSTLATLCSPDEGSVVDHLVRPQRGLHRLDWADPEPTTEFHIGAGDMVRLLRRTGFEVLDFIELFAPEDAVSHPYYNLVGVDWANRWPAEEIWRARKA
ncbi:MAG: class I SAM-dependent methyltransferase [Candidatus Dormibacteraeota bacterium]|nr:class I SAM-dependent methyltransferase [Candidatus Dormibacteraeota bacterium]